MMRGALYVRVSTKEQTTENQERELRQWAERLGFEVVAVYADTMSGARSDRAALAAVLTAAHRREFGAGADRRARARRPNPRSSSGRPHRTSSTTG
jgi:DNA invertase Pin-like site-specific DNA recombinase